MATNLRMVGQIIRRYDIESETKSYDFKKSYHELFKRFDSDNTEKFPFVPKTKTPLSPIQVQEISEAFALFDADKDNHLSPFEYKVCLNALGIEVKQQELNKLFEEHNLKPEANISYANFLKMTTTLASLRDPVTEMVRAFTLFDDEGNGKISYRNLKKISREIGENLTDEELHTMIDEFDRDGDRAINLEEFMAIMSDAT